MPNCWGEEVEVDALGVEVYRGDEKGGIDGDDVGWGVRGEKE